MSASDLISVARTGVLSFNNQFIFDGNGVLDKAKWVSAVETASAANPEPADFEGYPFASRWVDSGKSSPGKRGGWFQMVGARSRRRAVPHGSIIADWRAHLWSSSCSGQAAPKSYIQNQSRVMDAGGTLLWAEDIFRALRGEPVLGSTCTLNDEEVLKICLK